ncbi:hypothetical protein FGO68_gene1628 [Halteria grandinella]|uniref:Uncharacterized protein n=1 Tax=Halteria grandinella TaxID=5974 RepID=A0A8J8NG48_HALGN|nr:hypothetical protein FGO68_gene1628 [Halteria grandinella]
MNRQQQLEDAVIEARKINQMIEEEREKMKNLKQRMQENSLSQYVQLTKLEMKNDLKAQKTQGGPANDQDEEENSESEGDKSPVPGLIPPRNPKNGKPIKVQEIEPHNLFDDNYAFYMYYLNTSGQLVTPVDQMVLTNVQQREKLKKFKEQQEKESRVVKNKLLQQQLEEHNKKMAEEKDKKKKNRVESRVLMSKVRDGGPASKTDKSKKPSPNHKKDGEEDDTSAHGKKDKDGERRSSTSTKRDNSRNRALLIKKKAAASTDQQQPATPKPNKKYMHVQSKYAQQLAASKPKIVINEPGGDEQIEEQFKDTLNLRQSANKTKKKLNSSKGSVSSDKASNLSPSPKAIKSPKKPGTSLQQVRSKINAGNRRASSVSSMRQSRESTVSITARDTKAPPKPKAVIVSSIPKQTFLKRKPKVAIQSIKVKQQRQSTSRSQDGESPSPERSMDKKSRVKFDEMLEDKRISSSQDLSRTPLITLKRASDVQIETLHHPSVNNLLLQKPNSKSSNLKDSVEDTPLTLPPIPTSIPKPSMIPKPSSNISRPPLPSIKVSQSAQSITSMSIPSSSILPPSVSKIPKIAIRQAAYANSGSLSSGSIATFNTAPNKDSYREGNAGSQKSDSERQNSSQTAKEYYKEVKEKVKIKVDPKKKVEVELRKNSISLEEMESSHRAKPIKMFQLSDLLD